MAWLSRKFQLGGNWTISCPILSCSALVGMMLQLLACLACEQFLAACSRESPVRFSHESLFFLHTLEHFFTLSHSLPLQESHLNTRLLIAEIQVNLAWNKANKMVDKIQPYTKNYLRLSKWDPFKLIGWYNIIGKRDRSIPPLLLIISWPVFGYRGVDCVVALVKWELLNDAMIICEYGKWYE